MKTIFKHISLLVLLLMLPMAMWGVTETWGAGSRGARTFTGTNTITVTGTVTLTGTITISSGTTTFIFNGGTLDANSGRRIFSVSGTLNIQGTGTLREGKATAGGAIHIKNGGKVYMSGATISNCTATGNNENGGGGVYVANGGLFEMSKNATITGCKTTYTTYSNSLHGLRGCGGGVYVAKGGSFTMGGGKITNCRSTGSGCGLFVEGTFTMNAGEISYNWPDPNSDTWKGADWSTIMSNAPANTRPGTFTSVCGGGICVESKDGTARATINGGDIIYNKASSGGGMIVQSCYDQDQNDRTKGPIVTITGGTFENNQALNWSNGGAVYVQTATLEINVPAAQKLTLRNNKVLRYGGAINANASAKISIEGEGEILIEDNYSGMGGAISQEAGRCELYLNSNNLTIQRNSAEHTLDIWGQKFGSGGAIFIEQGDINMSAGLIQNNTATYYGGGVAIYANRITDAVTIDFTMTGGNILNNEADTLTHGLGGGVLIYADPVDEPATVTVDITGGTIENNHAYDGGGVCIAVDTETRSTADVTVGSGAEILANRAAHNGGGILLRDISTALTDLNKIKLNLEGTHIESNTAGLDGGGLLLYTGRLTVDTTSNSTSTTEMRDNHAGQNGGGIAVVLGIANIGRLSLKANTAKQDGGGFFLNNREHSIAGYTLGITVTDAIVSGNRAYNGGGLAIRDGEMTINHISLSGNSAEPLKGQGGGFGIKTMPDDDKKVRAPFSSLYIKQAEIFGNRAGHGGGFVASNSEVTIENMTMYDNHVDSLGGGFSVRTYDCDDILTLNILDAEIRDNTAQSGGGFAARTAKVTIEDIDLYDNTATEFGGGFAIKTEETKLLSDLKIHSANIHGNEATSGGGFYVNGAKVVVDSIQLYSNIAKNEGGGMTVNNNILPYDKDVVHLELLGGNIFSNTALRGGGIAIHDENVLLEHINIYNNVADIVGGGLYYRSTTTTTTNFQTIDFSDGGNIHHNEAISGAGIFLEGAVKMTVAGKVEQNVARTGGGAYLRWGAEMIFTRGVMRNNFARVSEAEEDANYQVAGQTAYKKLGDRTSGDYVSGVGGGFFLESRAKLSFNLEGTSKMGVYGNMATHGADDIFANGDGTIVKLPSIKNMSLREYEVPTNILYWAEDYVSDKDNNGTFMGDASYSLGTNLYTGEKNPYPNIRYRTALKMYPADVWTLYGAETSTGYDIYEDKYLCLALGYQLIFVDVVKTGMRVGDDANIQIYYPKGSQDGTGGEPTLYRELVLTRLTEGDDSPKKTVVLPEGYWIFEEKAWGSNYRLTGITSTGETISSNRFKLERRSDNTNHVVTMVNDLDTDVHDGSNRKVNYMKPDIPRTAPKKDR